MRRASGFTLFELLVVMAIVGIIMAIVPWNIKRDKLQTRQAAKVIAQQIQLARFEAVKRNRFAGVYFPSNGLSFTIYEDSNNDRAYSPTADTIIQTFVLGLADPTGDYTQTKLALTANQNILFDPRSFLYNTGTASAVTTLTVASIPNPSYKWKVEVTTQGRVIRVIQ